MAFCCACNTNEKNKNNADELPQGCSEHGIKNTKAFPERPAFFAKIKCTIAVNETAAVNNAGIAEASVVIDF